MSRNDGYITDVAYTHGYYAEISPSHIDLALTLAGHSAIPAGACCELGFGQGVSLAFHAAAHPGRRFYGNDFMPQHVQHAQSLVDAAKVSANLSDQSFANFCVRDDLPPFALIVLHGVWSWVSEANRQLIAEFIGRKLMPGGVLYISYNISAGWAAMVPLRELLALHVQRAQAPFLPSSVRIKEALAFAAKVFAADPITANHAPVLKKRLEGLQEQDPRYLTHEYLNTDWHISSFQALHAALQPAQMSYCASAMLAEHVASVQLNADQRALLSAIQDPVLRETTRDFFMGQPFRRDLWVKGGVPLSRADQAQAVRSLRLQLFQPLPNVPIKLRGARSEATLTEQFSRPILQALEGDGPAPSIGELQRRLQTPSFTANQIFETITMLIASGWVVAVRDEAHIRVAAPYTSALNAYLVGRAEAYGQIAHLISPVTGTAVDHSRLNQVFTKAISAGGAPTAMAAVDDIAARLASFGERVVHEGKALQPGAETQAALTGIATAYDTARPIYRRLEFIEGL